MVASGLFARCALPYTRPNRQQGEAGLGSAWLSWAGLGAAAAVGWRLGASSGIALGPLGYLPLGYVFRAPLSHFRNIPQRTGGKSVHLVSSPRGPARAHPPPTVGILRGMFPSYPNP